MRMDEEPQPTLEREPQPLLSAPVSDRSASSLGFRAEGLRPVPPCILLVWGFICRVSRAVFRAGPHARRRPTVVLDEFAQLLDDFVDLLLAARRRCREEHCVDRRGLPHLPLGG